MVADETVAQLGWKANRKIMLWFREYFSLLYMEQEKKLVKNWSPGVPKRRKCHFQLV